MHTIIIGKTIKQKRREKNMTQEELGKKIECHKGQIYRWEKETLLPNSINLLKIMKVLDLTVQDFENSKDESEN